VLTEFAIKGYVLDKKHLDNGAFLGLKQSGFWTVRPNPEMKPLRLS
jgi:hypothetical protein